MIQPNNYLSPLRVAEKLTGGLALLLEAYRYADDTFADHWEFAVEIRRLLAAGMNESDLRWLVKKGIVQHAREVTVELDEGREFLPCGGGNLGDRSCFVLSHVGAEEVTGILRDAELLLLGCHCGSDSQRVAVPIPQWIPDVRELRLNGSIVKRYKWQAINQETVLSAFEEDGWPTVIDDPLPPKSEQDPKRRLHDTIKALNRNQLEHAIRFRGNGNGEGIRWELLGRRETPCG